MSRLFTALVLLGAAGCEPKEALDPADILAEDPAFLPPEDEAGASAPEPGRREASSPRRPARATRTDCENAAYHLEELGRDLAISEATSDAERVALREERAKLRTDASVRSRVSRAAADCVERGTSLAEARCVAAVRSRGELDGCSR